MDTPAMTPSVRERCRVRLENDLAALRRFARSRQGLEVRADVRGDRILEIALCFERVRTAFLDTRTGEVEVREAPVTAVIRPAASEFSYPLGPPQVRLYYPGRPGHLVPHLGGVFWDDGTGLPAVILRLLREMERAS
jgi:hypothetical protein